MVKRKRGRWTRKRVILIGSVMLIVVGFVIFTLWAESWPLGPRFTLSVVGYRAGMQIPTGNYPINESAASIFVTHFIDDYRNEANNEWNYQVPANVARFFPLYVSSGETWEVEVANEFPSGNRTEFLFVEQIPGNTPQIVPYTNVTAPYLRPFVDIAGGGLNSTARTYDTPYGSGERHLVIENAAGISDLPLFYDTNSSLVHNDPMDNAKSAAVALYNADVFDMNVVLNPQYPNQPGWFWNYANSALGRIVEFSGLFAIFITIFESKSGGWISKHLKQIRRPSSSPDTPPPEKSEPKSNQSNDEDEEQSAP